MPDVVMPYLVMINALGFAIMGADKRRAIMNQWRIPEKDLFLISAIGGSLGTFVGMYLFRHKTKHWYFVLGMPAILLIHVIIVIYLKKMHIL